MDKRLFDNRDSSHDTLFVEGLGSEGVGSTEHFPEEPGSWCRRGLLFSLPAQTLQHEDVGLLDDLLQFQFESLHGERLGDERVGTGLVQLTGPDDWTDAVTGFSNHTGCNENPFATTKDELILLPVFLRTWCRSSAGTRTTPQRRPLCTQSVLPVPAPR